MADRKAGDGSARRSGTTDPADDTDAAADPGGPDEGFRGPVVCELVGISYRQLDYWARTGLLRPSISDARGSGTQRRYSYRDVLELKVIKQLLDAGLKLRQARQAVECLRGDLGGDLASAQLVLAGSRSVLAHSDGEVVDLLAGGQGVLNILPLSGVVSELAAAVVEIGTRAGTEAEAEREAEGAAHPAAAGDLRAGATGSGRSAAGATPR